VWPSGMRADCSRRAPLFPPSSTRICLPLGQGLAREPHVESGMDSPSVPGVDGGGGDF